MKKTILLFIGLCICLMLHAQVLKTLTVTAGGVDSQTITFTQKFWPTDVNDLVETQSQLKYYPNPFADQISIEIQNPKRDKITVEIFNILGQKIKPLINECTD